MRTQRGFTLIEMLVVIAIIGLLSMFTTVWVVGVRERSRTTLVNAQLTEIRRGIQLLIFDTGKFPGGCAASGIHDSEIQLNDPQSGLIQQPTVGPTGMGTDCSWTAQDIAAWHGPYVTRSIDPWGHTYWYDPDYYPRRDCATDTSYPGDPVYGVLFSDGPNGVGGQPPYYSYDCDDIFLLLLPNDFSKFRVPGTDILHLANWWPATLFW